VLVKSSAGHWQAEPVTPGARTEPGIAIYRFGTSLYYANSARLLADLQAVVRTGGPLDWLVLDLTAVEDIDFTAASVLTNALRVAKERRVRFALCGVLAPVLRELDRYGITGTLGPDACYETPGAALEAFHARNG
jgi:MFS superfamily sulfate permease-like transporter